MIKMMATISKRNQQEQRWANNIMITPLDPNEIEAEKKREDSSVQKRRNALAEEEAILIGRVNDLRDIEKREKDRIRTEVEEAQAAADLKIGSLQSEVTALESRRAAALKPISELQAQADGRIAAVEVREKACEEREKDLLPRERAVMERAEHQIDLQEDLDECKEDLDLREKGIAAEELRLKGSEESLAAKWSDFHATVYAKNAELETRESSIRSAEQSNETVRQSLDIQRKDQDERERQLRDRYETLGKAVKEFEQKQNHG